MMPLGVRQSPAADDGILSSISFETNGDLSGLGLFESVTGPRMTVPLVVRLVLADSTEPYGIANTPANDRRRDIPRFYNRMRCHLGFGNHRCRANRP